MKSYDFNLYDFCKSNRTKQMYEIQSQLVTDIKHKSMKNFDLQESDVENLSNRFNNGGMNKSYNKDFKISSFVGHIESTMEIDKRYKYDYEYVTQDHKVLIKASRGLDTLVDEPIMVLEYKTKIGYSKDKIVDETIYLTNPYDISQTIKSNIRNKNYSTDDKLIVHEFESFLEFLNYIKDKKENQND